MDAKELREKTPDQLRDELTNLKKEAFNLRRNQLGPDGVASGVNSWARALRTH